MDLSLNLLLNHEKILKHCQAKCSTESSKLPSITHNKHSVILRLENGLYILKVQIFFFFSWSDCQVIKYVFTLGERCLHSSPTIQWILTLHFRDVYYQMGAKDSFKKFLFLCVERFCNAYLKNFNLQTLNKNSLLEMHSNEIITDVH